MTVLDELQIPGLPESVVREAKLGFVASFWGRYDRHGDDVLVTFKVRWLTVTCTLKEARLWLITIPLLPLWEAAFGKR